jgi:glycosyltransferase involved in cell wall biosynthesis
VRIAQISPLYESVPPQSYGGTERVVSYLTEALVEAGHQVTLFASADSVTSAELVPCCDRSLRLWDGSVDPLAHHLLMLERVAELADRFDILHFHIDYLHFPRSRLHGWPTVTTLHGRLDIPDLQPLYREFHDMPLVSISDAQRAPLPGARWMSTVHHGLPPSLYTPGRVIQPYLAFLGRISPEKRVDRAIEIARQAGLPIRIAAKIDAADRTYFEREIAHLFELPFVEYLGEVGGRDKERLLGGAAALLFPIDWSEPFGLVMIEAMACGTPVIAWREGSVPEVVSDGVTGFIVESVDDAVRAIARLGEIDRRGCREEFDRRFTVARMARDYVRVYARVIEAHRGSTSTLSAV